MPFTMPADPFPEAMGRALSTAGGSIASAYTKRKDRKKQEEENYNLAVSLGVPKDQAQQFAKMNPSQVPTAAKSVVSKQQVPAYADFLIKSMDLDKDSPMAQNLREARDVDSLVEMGKFMATQQKGKPKEVSPYTQMAIKFAQTGKDIPPEVMDKIKDPEQIRLINSFQKTKVEEKAIPEPKRQEIYIKKNLDYGDDLRAKFKGSERALDTTRQLNYLIESGATNNQLSNYAVDKDVDWLKPFFEKPGSRALLIGGKNLFTNFTELFGARPNIEEFKMMKKTVPDLLGSKNGKLAAVQMRESIEKGNVAEYKGYQQALQELGDEVAPHVLQNRADELVKDEKERIFQEWRVDFNELMRKTNKVKEGNILYYNSKTDEVKQAPEEHSKRFKELGWRPVRA